MAEEQRSPARTWGRSRPRCRVPRRGARSWQSRTPGRLARRRHLLDARAASTHRAHGELRGRGGLVLAHLVSRIDRRVPVLFLDTGFHFSRGRSRSARQFATAYGLECRGSEARTSESRSPISDRIPTDAAGSERWNPYAALWPDSTPGSRGVRAEQSTDRGSIRDVLERHDSDGHPMLKVYLARSPPGRATISGAISGSKGASYHPLLDQGYTSIGCWPCCTRSRRTSGSPSGRAAGREPGRPNAASTRSRPSNDCTPPPLRRPDPGTSIRGQVSFYPVPLNLRGRRVVVVGGGAVAEQKALGLLEAGAVSAPRQSRPDLEARGPCAATGSDHFSSAVPYRNGDLAGASLAIAATDERDVNALVWTEAEARKHPAQRCGRPAALQLHRSRRASGRRHRGRHFDRRQKPSPRRPAAGADRHTHR